MKKQRHSEAAKTPAAAALKAQKAILDKLTSTELDLWREHVNLTIEEKFGNPLKKSNSEKFVSSILNIIDYKTAKHHSSDTYKLKNGEYLKKLLEAEQGYNFVKVESLINKTKLIFSYKLGRISINLDGNNHTFWVSLLFSTSAQHALADFVLHDDYEPFSSSNLRDDYESFIYQLMNVLNTQDKLSSEGIREHAFNEILDEHDGIQFESFELNEAFIVGSLDSETVILRHVKNLDIILNSGVEVVNSILEYAHLNKCYLNIEKLTLDRLKLKSHDKRIRRIGKMTAYRRNRGHLHHTTDGILSSFHINGRQLVSYK
ncbi:hypothetical protein [Vibrio agarivorans]|uniref:hypothetical protein n=1 Tax=Vibrio agarivorans TaxID=153622 RepID=UPI0025B5CAAF|nr:hypothetical protein [Vibrio agarivorans]MDN3663148.1 hypothetical protein [Vibrio agarivorans]